MENLPATQKNAIINPKDAAESDVLLLRAIDANVPVETLERLLAMREKMRQEHAAHSFNEAMAQFQAMCPIISKTKTVNDKSGKARYSYAPLEAIVAQVKSPLKDCGFSYRITAEIVPASENGKPDWVQATCSVTHVQGHTEQSTFKVPIDKDAFMNEQQKVASALTYAKRYAFCNAFGIMTGDEDDDSQGAGEPQKTKDEKPAAPPANPTPSPYSGKLISDAQRKRFYAISKSTGASDEQIKDWLFREFGFEHSKDITVEKYNAICEKVVKDLTMKEGG